MANQDDMELRDAAKTAADGKLNDPATHLAMVKYLRLVHKPETIIALLDRVATGEARLAALERERVADYHSLEHMLAHMDSVNDVADAIIAKGR